MSKLGNTASGAASGATAGATFGPWGAAAGGIIGGVAGFFGSDQKEEQQGLTDIQYTANKGLMHASYEEQRELYDHTYSKNTPLAQIKNLKAAGLNPALIYGSGGGGVSNTTTGGGGASVGGATASGSAERQATNTQQIGMALQLAKLKSEVDVNESVAKINNTEAEKKAGVDTKLGEANIAKIAEETGNEKVRNSILNIQKSVDLFSASSNIQIVELRREQAQEELNRMSRENEIGEEVKEAIIREINNKAELSVIELALRGVQVEVTKEQLNAIKEGINQKWNEIEIMDQNQQIKAVEAEIKMNMPSIGGVAGGVAKQVINGISKMMGGTNYEPKLKR